MTNDGTILLIESNDDDVLLIRKALVEAKVINPVQAVSSFNDAAQYLSGDGVYANRGSYPQPVLVILDLRLPDEGGFALMRWLYERPGLRKRFSVIILSADAPDQEVHLAYALGAQSFLVKPLQFRQLVDTLRRIKEYWLDMNVLPGDPPRPTNP